MPEIWVPIVTALSALTVGVVGARKFGNGNGSKTTEALTRISAHQGEHQRSSDRIESAVDNLTGAIHELRVELGGVINELRVEIAKMNGGR